MHIPDGYLSARTALAGGVLSASGLGFALRRLRAGLPARRVPLLGLAAAFIFAAQMLNFPILGGTSGHLLGASLAAILLGPSAAVVVMACVLILQCFLFADGGLLALGANLFNMAIVAPCVAHAIYATMTRFAGGLRGRLLAAAFASWCSVTAAAVVCAGQLALSGAAAWQVVLPAMAGLHMLIGFGEAAVTTLIVAAIARARPEILGTDPAARAPVRVREVAGFGLLVSIGLAVFVGPFASPWPDALARVAARLGFAHGAAPAAARAAPLAGYAVRWIRWTAASTAVAGAVGTAAAFLFALAMARLLAPGRRVAVGRAEE